MQIGEQRFEDALQVEEIQRLRRRVRRVAPELLLPHAAQDEGEAARLVGQFLVGPRQIYRADLEQPHVVGVLQVRRGDVEHAGEQAVPHDLALAADGVLQADVLAPAASPAASRVPPWSGRR